LRRPESFRGVVGRGGSKGLANWFFPAYPTLLFTGFKIKS
jgi:hypothetical protein